MTGAKYDARGGEEVAQAPPIIFVGNGRSGSSLLFGLCSHHPKLGWLSQYENYLSGFYAGGMLRSVFETRLWHLSGIHNGERGASRLRWVVPKPTEGYGFWDREAGDDVSRSWLWTRRPSRDAARRVRKAIGRILRWQGKRRFVAKFTGPGRIGYLKHLFPDARFVHLIRDVEPQVSSILNVEFWKKGGGLERLYWPDDPPPFLADFLARAERAHDPVVLAAAQWRSVVEGIRAEARRELQEHEYAEITYLDLVSDPGNTMRSLWRKFEMEDCEAALGRMTSEKFDTRRDEQLINQLTPSQRELIARWSSDESCLGAQDE